MILIVDDKKENIFSLKSLLELNKFQVDTAASGEEALVKILKNTYSLIILDVQMPGMDGFEVAETVSGYSKARDIPIIFLSAVSKDKRFITKGYASGGIDYITKPFDPDLLLLKVKTLYRLSEQNRALTRIQASLTTEIEFRKQAEKNLSEKVEELKGILESIPQIAFTTRPDGSIEFVNQHWFAYADNKDHFPHSDKNTLSIKEYVQKAIDLGEPLLEEVCICKLNDPDFRYHLLSMTPVKSEGLITKWVGILTDIHGQKMINQLLEQRVAHRTRELQKMNDELETSNHELQQYASVASHDLKEPLRKIQVFTQIIRDRYLHNNGEAMDYMNRVIGSVSRMTNLINDLLAFSGLSVHSLYQSTNVTTIIHEIIIDLEVPIHEKQAIITVGDIPEMEVIPGQIRQVFQNIISNSLKFSKPAIHPEIKIIAERISSRSFTSEPDAEGAYCRITVTDNGIGFNEVYLDKIFSLFQRLNAKEKYDGTGIGLAIVKKIIDKHNGLVTARSIENEGAAFIIILPIKQTAESIV